MKLLEKQSGDLLATYRGHSNTSYHINACFTKADAYVCSGGEDGVITFWELVEARVARQLKGHRRAVCSVARHPTSNVLLSASFDGTVRVWG